MQTFKTRKALSIYTDTVQGMRRVFVPLHTTLTILPRLDQGIDLSLRQISRAVYNKHYKQPDPPVVDEPVDEAPIEESPATDETTEETDGN